MVAEEMWTALGQLECLETVILVCTDHHILSAKERWVLYTGERELNTVFVNVSHGYHKISDKWRKEDKVSIREVQFPIRRGGGTFRKESLEWIESRVLKGETCIES